MIPSVSLLDAKDNFPSQTIWVQHITTYNTSQDKAPAIPSSQRCERADHSPSLTYSFPCQDHTISVFLPGATDSWCFWERQTVLLPQCTLTPRALLLWMLPEHSDDVWMLQRLEKMIGLKDKVEGTEWKTAVPPAAHLQLNPGLALPIWWLCALRHNQKGDALAHRGDLLGHTHLLYFSAELQCWKHMGTPWSTN